MTAILLGCGGRDYNDAEYVTRQLDALHKVHNFSKVVHGGARGADTLVKNWAIMRGIPCTEYPAFWGVYGRSAGYRRNSQMLGEGNPDLVVAFPGGPGTANMVKLSLQANKEVIVCSGRS